ncbi:MAG TPA: VWA-like domain-containing protein [Vitreimonas sp.]|uniref:vWA domain-containing protein n=1 Tax=Vitreimonas sp. TaxID=3069702 RepID=UPI002D75E3E2|nr:VWA-like domain-containing protein [Vitreimonas sp.]HYD87440.1 VWA-like domain-containing protein [Vitreimonas sp.]
MTRRSSKREARIEAIQEGLKTATPHPLLSALPEVSFDFLQQRCPPVPPDALLSIAYELTPASRWYPESLSLVVRPNLERDSEPGDWPWAIARIRLHAALNHIDPERNDIEWSAACWAVAEALLINAGLGSRPAWLPPLPQGYKLTDENALSARLRERIPDEFLALGLGAHAKPFWSCNFDKLTAQMRRDASRAFADGVRAAATGAVQGAGISHAQTARKDSEAERCRAWFVSNYPLLASLASGFSIIEDPAACDRLAVRVAAVQSEMQEIYVNPKAGLHGDEMRFVMAHEILHVGLRHEMRRQGRDPWLWNVACDFVINGWLLEMGVGAPPEKIGFLFDPELKGASAEEIYDRITSDLRVLRKVKKLRGWVEGGPDVLGDKPEQWWRRGGADLDAFYRRALQAGLELHQTSGRGLLPGGLIEEIKALDHPVIPWDVALGDWLDSFFEPVEVRRTYARASRRQESSPDIPRPGRAPPLERSPDRTFGVLLDSSGSMDRVILARALGAIRAYALSREVRAVRLIQCDAYAHDSGYVTPDDLLETFEIRGRGGTVLMPGIRLLETAPDFPSAAPILVITDGASDALTIRREHAFLTPSYGKFEYRTLGPVFRMREELDDKTDA